MANPSWDGVKGYATIASSGTNSNSVNVPAGCRALTLFIPQLTTATTVKIQALSMLDQTTWADAFVGSEGATQVVDEYALSGLGSGTANTVLTLPAGFFPGGTIRFVASASQTGGAVTISLLFH